jgi:hypothetical protein
MFDLRVVLLASVAVLTGCATHPSLKDGYAAITVNSRFGEENKNRSISAIDGESTGTMFQPKTVYVKPGVHTVVRNVFCNGCPIDGQTKFELIVEAGYMYVLPADSATTILVLDERLVPAGKTTLPLHRTFGNRFE